MFRKNYFTFLLAIALFMAGSLAVFAQTAPVRGQVVLKKADGTIVPLANAVIDVYRTDTKGKLPSGKTNSKGEFSFAGFPLGATFAFAVSAPNAAAQVFPGVKAGNEKVTITVVEGSGNRFTEDEARQALNAPAPAVNQTAELTPEQKKALLTPEQKKALEKYEKEVADIQAKNKNIENINVVVSRSLEEGDKQFKVKNYDAAITSYEAGYSADPEFAGSAPIFLNKKASALLNRATDKNNATVKADATVRIEALASIKKDYADAVVALDRALAILKTANDPDPKAQKGFAEVKYNTLEKRKEVFRLMSRTGADRTRGKEALVAFQEYIDATTDAKIKADAQAALTEVLMDSQEFELAITESEKILAQDPNNVNALAVAGLSLVNVGYINNDKSKLQQGSNYLQKFTEVAPDTNQYKADAKGLIESLKKEQNVTPQKSTRKKQ